MKRLNVLLEDDELTTIQALAKRRGQTTAAFVREALRSAREAAERTSPEVKLRAIRKAAAHAYPITDIDDLLAQIESDRAYAGIRMIDRLGG